MGTEGWAAVGSVGSIISGITSLLMVFFAWRALHAWQDQVRYEVGRRYRVLLYRLRDIIIKSLESESTNIELFSQIRFREDSDGSELGSPSRRFRAWESHWNTASSQISTVKQELEAIGHEIESTWGSSVTEATEDLRTLANEIIDPMYLVAADAPNGYPDSSFDLQRLHSPLVDNHGRVVPEFAARLQAAVMKAESIVDTSIHPERRDRTTHPNGQV